LEHKTENGKQLFSYVGYVQSGITAIPLPETAMPDTFSLVYHGKDMPLFQRDQNYCIYITSKSKQIISFQFALKEKDFKQPPLSADSEKVIFSSLTKATQDLLARLRGTSTAQQI
jgi:hypothetical protein